MKKILVIVLVLAGIAGYFMFGRKKQTGGVNDEVKPERGSISIEFKVTGSVEPRNRLEIKPQVSGRIEEMLSKEGQAIKKGGTVAWMSSSDRAALIDAARSSNQKELSSWEDIYKPTPIIAPIEGFIIARLKEPGQTVSPSDVIFVLADRLIVEANVDETDLRNIEIGRRIDISLDSYPDKKFKGVIEHIAYEATVVNNVTVYKIKILPLSIPDVFRAGMTATVNIVAQKKDNALLLPSDAIIDTAGKKFVMVKKTGRVRASRRQRETSELGTEPGAETKDSGRSGRRGKKKSRKKPTMEFTMREVETGIDNGKMVEIISGVNEDEVILMPEVESAGTTSRFRGGIPGLGGGR